MKNEILRENLRQMIKMYGMDNALTVCFELEKDSNKHDMLPVLLSLTTQFYHRSRWIYDAQTGNTIDTWAPLIGRAVSRPSKRKMDLVSLLKGLKGKEKIVVLDGDCEGL